MKRSSVLLVLMPLLLAACMSSEGLTVYESDELVAVKHNQHSDCTLLIYRDPMGQSRHVFRKHGVFEFGILYTLEGEILLKERGRQERSIKAFEADRVTKRINSLLRVNKPEPEQAQAQQQLSNT